jgi:hypothetical protein
MGFVNGVNLLPSTGEFTYATTARLGQRVTETALTGINFYFAGGRRKPIIPTRSTSFRQHSRHARPSRSSAPGLAIRFISIPRIAKSTHRPTTSTTARSSTRRRGCHGRRCRMRSNIGTARLIPPIIGAARRRGLGSPLPIFRKTRTGRSFTAALPPINRSSSASMI